MVELTKAELKQSMEKTTEPVGMFFYTPLCGTCQVAERMLDVITHMKPQWPLHRCNINLMADVAREWRIESVPCLIVIAGREIMLKEYAIQSVPHLYEKLKSIFVESLCGK